MIVHLNPVRTLSCFNTWLFLNCSWLIRDYEHNADFRSMILNCFSLFLMRKSWKQNNANRISEKMHKTDSSVHYCMSFEVDWIPCWVVDYVHNLNYCFFWSLFSDLTHLFNQHKRKTSWNRRIQNVAVKACNVFQKVDWKKHWWNRLKDQFR